MNRLRTLTIVLLVLLIFPVTALADPGDVSAEIMATPQSAVPITSGYAFVCLTYLQDSGARREYYGFYPAAKPGEMVIGSPALANETVS